MMRITFSFTQIFIEATLLGEDVKTISGASFKLFTILKDYFYNLIYFIQRQNLILIIFFKE